MFVMQLLEPPSWLYSVSTVLLLTDLLHLVGQCPHWTPKICLVPVPHNSCICGGVIPVIIVYIPQCTLVFVVLSSFWIQSVHNSCICGGVIPVIIVYIPQCTLVFVVLSSFWIQSVHNTLVVSQCMEESGNCVEQCMLSLQWLHFHHSGTSYDQKL